VCVKSGTHIEPSQWTDGLPIRNVLSITTACRQTRLESLTMFYSLNEFGGMGYRWSDRHQKRFIDRLQEPQRLAIKYWWLDIGHLDNVIDLDVPLNRLPNLQKCTIMVWIKDMLHSHDAEIKRIIEQQAGRELEVLIENHEELPQ
jgi:hypothetical protein